MIKKLSKVFQSQCRSHKDQYENLYSALVHKIRNCIMPKKYSYVWRTVKKSKVSMFKIYIFTGGFVKMNN